MKRMYTEYPHIHSIYLCLDNDEPGNERCRQFVSLIPEELSVYRLEPVKKDWNECLVAEVPVENMAKQMCWRDAREKPVPVMKMSEVEETVVVVMVSVHSLWKGYFDPGESGKRKNVACNGNRRILYKWKRTSQCTSHRTL